MIFKKIFIGISLILSLSATAVFASELPFDDVTEQTPYYSAVDRLYNMGIISGYEDGTFKPNNKISVAEGITLAEKLFGDTSALPPIWSEWFCDKCGWNNHIELNGYPFRGDYSAVMTYETALELLLKLNNLTPINAAMWNTDVKYGGFSDYTNTMYVRGYEKRTSYCGITRAEFCNMLVFMIDYDGEYVIPKSKEPIIEPEIYGGSITNSRETILNAQSEMICVPEFVRKEFAESGYRMILVSNDNWTELFDNKYSGIYNSQKKSIYIRMGYYYTTDGTEPQISDTRKQYAGEKLSITGAVTVKAVYFSACGKCVKCKDDKKAECLNGVYGKVGTYRYTVPTIIHTGGGGGGGGRTIDKTRKYTKDIFGNEHPTHIGYINGYPDGSVQPNGNITREEITSILYRIVNHDYEKPFIPTGDAFPDVAENRWSAHDIEYMSDKGIIHGYPDKEFKPANNLTRAEFAALISRFAKFEKTDAETPFPDVDSSHWAYDDILKLSASGLMQGYEDGTYHPEDMITRAEVMTVINKILGRNPSESYVKSLDYNPFTDLVKDKWYYTAVLEATVTHNYYLDDSGLEIKWEDCK